LLAAADRRDYERSVSRTRTASLLAIARDRDVAGHREDAHGWPGLSEHGQNEDDDEDVRSV
jgi:hypothetical protein